MVESISVFVLIFPSLLIDVQAVDTTNFPKPQCSNLLANLTMGSWVALPLTLQNNRQTHNQMMEERSTKLDSEMRRFWKMKGFPSNNFGSKKTCGFQRSRSATPTGRKVGQWCNSTSSTPCCSNKQWGMCVNGTSSYCRCPNCVDSRTFHHASLRQWQTDDVRCLWHNYTRDQACDVISASPYDDIYYVGDSYARSMYLAMLMILTDREITGAWRNIMTQEALEYCSDSAFTTWKLCRQLSEKFEDMKYKNELCGGRNVTFRAQLKRYYNKRYAEEFLELVQSNIGKEGVLLLVSVGFHERYHAANVIWKYLDRAVRLIRLHYADQPPQVKRWPDIKYMMPMRLGLLQPVNLLRSHPISRLRGFETHMRKYCAWTDIDVMDFQGFGQKVISYDGVHYDLSVNKMKNQVLLNYMASLQRL